MGLGFRQGGKAVDTVWFGVKLGIGIVIGMALIRFVWHQITSFALTREFTKRGCTYQHEGGSEFRPNGWMTRDPSSREGLAEFLSLADGYNNLVLKKR